jgi:ABC-type uncharacterized transport system ATPase subunit
MEDDSRIDRPLLEVDNLSVRLGRPPVQAVREISFRIRHGGDTRARG